MYLSKAMDIEYTWIFFKGKIVFNLAYIRELVYWPQLVHLLGLERVGFKQLATGEVTIILFKDKLILTSFSETLNT